MNVFSVLTQTSNCCGGKIINTEIICLHKAEVIVNLTDFSLYRIFFEKNKLLGSLFFFLCVCSLWSAR